MRPPHPIAALALLALAAAPATPEKLPVRAEPPAGKTHYVGEQLRFPVIVSFVERPLHSPRFDIPATGGGTLLQLPGSPVFGTQRIDGTDYTTWRYDFAYYPHRAETHTIPAITARAAGLSGHSAAFKIDAQLPPGADGLATLISTTDLVVKETWHPQPGATATAGDAFTRTITLRAPDVMGMGFPPLPLAKPDGVALYPKAPQIDDHFDRGDILGARTETLVYVLQAVGKVTLPAISIPWFDLAANEMRRVDLPAHTLTVAPAADQIGGDGDATTETNTARVMWLVALLVSAAAVTAFFVRRRDPDSEPRRFRRLLKAAHTNDPIATIDRSTAWLQSLPGGDPPRTLRDLAPDDTALQAAIDTLYAVGYARVPAPDWDGRPLARLLTTARRQRLHQTRHAAPALEPLNP